ncbi:hypothetical protein [Methylobacterium sp. CM6244]
MSGTGERAKPQPTEQGEEARLWGTTAAIMAFDVDGGGSLAFKHTSGQIGTLSAEDNLNGRMRLVSEQFGEVSAYDSVEALVRDGWSLDENSDVSPNGQ